MLEKGDAASSSAPLYSTLDSDKSYKCWLFMRNSVKNVFHTSVFFRRLSTTCLSVSESTFTLAWNFPCWPQNAEMISFISKLHRNGQPNYTFNQTIRDTFLFLPWYHFTTPCNQTFAIFFLPHYLHITSCYQVSCGTCEAH